MRLFLLLLLACKASPEASLLGGERGLDHVGIAVKDLVKARTTFKSVLGFGALEEGKLPNGIANMNYYFEDGSYLETMNAWDADKARWLADFTAAREGAAFFVLSIFSTDATTAFLAKRGLKTGAPIAGSITTAKGENHWSTMFIEPQPLPFFFIAYPQPKRAQSLALLDEARASGRIYTHPNTVVGIKAVWHAVSDVQAAKKTLTDMGLQSAGTFAEPRLGAVGEKFKVGNGHILLAAPAQEDSVVAKHLKERGGPSLLAVSFEVSSFEAGKRFAGRAGPTEEGRGVLGKSVFAFAHGTWLEFFSAKE